MLLYETRLNQARENDRNRKCGKCKMCEAAVCVTQHTVLWPDVFISRKSAPYNKDEKYSIVNT